jgi:hypothetical protein
MTDSVVHRGFAHSLIRSVLRPVYYPARHYYRLFRIRIAGTNISQSSSISMGFTHEESAQLIKAAVSPRVHWLRVALDSGKIRDSVNLYFERHRETYEIDKGRGKALEHALGLELLDFSRVTRYCDVASCASPIQKTFAEHYPQVEFWMQDLTYQDDLPHFRVGGFAQNMSAVPDGFFDAMTLHNSFEHFMGAADGDFVREVDRVLSPIGACLIIPLFVASTHRIYFDPVAVTPPLLRTYDKGAELIPVRGFANQEHARCYDPATLQERLISRLPDTLEATIVDFTGGASISPDMFPEFALVLHRCESVFGWAE